MANKVMQDAEKMTLRHSRKKIWQKIVIFLCCVVVFCTTYALILPAITMENNPVCGFVEHQHDESCFTQPEEIKQLICTNESDHVHDESCYHDVDVLTDLLICEDTSEEHEHDETCYTKVVKQELDCKHEHSEECKETIEHKELSCETEHEHTDECYQITIEEIDNCKHEHSEECYKNVKEKQLNCEIHAHDDSCYEIIIPEKELSCDIPVHTHNESCYEAIDLLVQGVIEKINVMPSADEIDAELLKYEENEDYEGYETYYTEVVKQVVSTYNAYSKLTDEQKEKVTNADKLLELEYIWSMHILAEPIPLDGFIERVEMKHKKYYESIWKDVVNGEVETGDDLKFYIYFEIPGKTLSTTNNTVVYKPPIEITKQEEGKVYDGNVEVGDYIISTDGTITIIFNDEYATKNANNADISGHIAFQSSVDKLESNTQGDASVTIKDEIKIQIVDKVNNNEDLQVNKEAFNPNEKDGTVTYEIKVSSANGTGSEVVLTDIMTGVQLNNINNITVKNKSGNTVNGVNRQNTGNGFILTLPQMGENSEYTITYTANINDISNLNGRKEFKNDVIVTSTDKVGGRLEDDDTVTQTITREVLSKSGKKNGENIDWTITINKSGLDISGWTLRDQLQGTEYTGTVTISPNPTGNGTITTTLPYKFPDNSKTVTYTVTYSTPAVSNTGSAVINNTAILTSPNGGNIQVGTGVNSRENQNGLDKIALGTEPSEQGDDGLAIFNWKVVFNATEQALEPYEQTIDKTRENAWVFTDELWNENIHWITGAQLKELKANLEIALNDKYDSTFKIIAYRWDGTGGSKFRDPVVVDDSLPDEKKYSQFRVLFYGTIPLGNIIEVEYSTTVNVSGSSSKVSATNYAFLNEKEVTKQPSQSYTPVITKVDMIDPNGGNITYHEIDDLYRPYLKEDVIGILTWDVYVTFPNEINGDVNIIEKLPEGVTLLNEVIPYEPEVFYDQSLTLEFGSSGEIQGTAAFDFYEKGNETLDEYPYIAHHHFEIPKGSGQYIPVIARKNKDNTNEITITVPVEIAQLLEGTTNKLTVKVVINDNFDWDTTSKEFKNTAILNYDGKNLGQATHTQVIHSPRILKTIRGASDNVISYQLTINESRKDLLPDSDTLVIEDKLEFDKPSSGTVNANLMLNSVKAYKVLADGTKVEITKDTSFTTSETEADNKIYKKFEMIVPDNERIIVEYNYRISGSIGTNVDILNTASIKGRQTTVEKDEYKYVLQIQESNAGVTLKGIKITKVDADNHLVTLEGALFSLQELINGEFVEIARFDTNNEEGSFYTNDLEMKPNVPYQVVELEAPYGYEKDPTPYKFMIAGSTNDTKPENFDGKYLNNGDSITIINKKIEYELPETGGIGTHLYYIGGITLMLISFLAYHILNRKGRCNE